jgi:hypothetical protein
MTYRRARSGSCFTQITKRAVSRQACMPDAIGSIRPPAEQGKRQPRPTRNAVTECEFLLARPRADVPKWNANPRIRDQGY